MDCVDHDSAVLGFLPPLSLRRITEWWEARIKGVFPGGPLDVFFVEHRGNQMHDVKGDGKAAARGEVVGVVMLSRALGSETGPFRGSVDKLLVAAEIRKKGIARSLVRALEVKAGTDGTTLLVSRSCACHFASC